MGDRELSGKQKGGLRGERLNNMIGMHLVQITG